jgi:cation transport regulator ChaB
MRYHCREDRTACVKHERKYHTREQICEDVYGVKVKQSKEDRREDYGARNTASLVFVAKYSAKDKFLANSGNYRICYHKVYS